MKDFIIFALIICGMIIIIRYAAWLIFSSGIEKSKGANNLCLYLKDLINGHWSRRPKPVFVMGEFEGAYKGREVVYKLIESKFPMEPDEVYLLLKPQTPWMQNITPSMSFHFALKSYPHPTENTYLKEDWLIYRPKLSRKVESAGEFYMDKQRLTQALEELTQAAEIVEKGIGKSA